MSNSNKTDAVYNAKSLGRSKVLILGLQHMFLILSSMSI